MQYNSLYRYCINSIYVLCKDSFYFSGGCEKIVKKRGDGEDNITNK